MENYDVFCVFFKNFSANFFFEHFRLQTSRASALVPCVFDVVYAD